MEGTLLLTTKTQEQSCSFFSRTARCDTAGHWQKEMALRKGLMCSWKELNTRINSFQRHLWDTILHHLMQVCLGVWDFVVRQFLWLWESCAGGLLLKKPNLPNIFVTFLTTVNFLQIAFHSYTKPDCKSWPHPKIFLQKEIPHCVLATE